MISSRATRDIDVLAIVDGEELTSAQPLPAALAGAAQTVARDFGCPNPGPTSLLDLGLPEGCFERAQHRAYDRSRGASQGAILEAPT
jgi:hypothetical protein